MPDQPAQKDTAEETLHERWQSEQRNWQRLVMEYVDKASTDEKFLVNLGNAMRGSLLANKPYPGTAEPASEPAERAELDEVVFGLRRVEGRLLELTLAIDALTRSGSTFGADSAQPATSRPETSSHGDPTDNAEDAASQLSAQTDSDR